ncbi:hypothetical protein [Mammaliicoccus sciuri]|uniref:hypothetical protein n=1 Tax=Mammaliicoccus sciuri TaxID=1296 RepID=UPI001954E8E4|nr:hypothetical protein [Mammaliicoccus sciuri]
MFEGQVETVKTDNGLYAMRTGCAIEERLQPKMMVNITDGYIIVEDTEENVKKFKTLIEWSKDILYDNENPYIKCKVFYNIPEEFNKIWEGISLRADLSSKRKQEELIANPPISEDIKEINDLRGLIQYLIEERNSNINAINYEYSGDDLDDVILEAEQKELQRLADLYLKEGVK